MPDHTLVLSDAMPYTLAMLQPEGGGDGGAASGNGGGFTPPGSEAAATQGADGSGTPGTPGPAAAPGGNSTFLFVMVGLMVFMILMTVTSGRKQKKQREALMSGLKKHDKVLTNGGVIGTIAEMNDSEVVLKVDESSNTRIRFAKSAVTTIISSGRTDSSDHDS